MSIPRYPSSPPFPFGSHKFSKSVCFCFASKLISIIFKDSTYKWYHMIFIFLCLTCDLFMLLWMVLFSSVAESCLTLCDPMDCSTPGLPVHHQLPEFTQTHVHWVVDAIQPSHPLSSPPPPAFNLSQIRVFSNESVLTSGGQSIGVSASASVLPMNTQDWSPLGWSGWISLLSKGLLRVFPNTTVQKHRFFCAQLWMVLSRFSGWVIVHCMCVPHLL